ncbi:oligosaccharide flippase family protein [Sediminicola luteus]|uniref:Oligosaccharide flippase family protein n=1 Tax=Sediminicola luteus TaxID=319238 RepID=A0ABV2TU38_9FLAO
MALKNNNFLFTKDLRKIFVNFGYLSLLQLIGIIGPIVIFPYLIDKLGKENYGLIIFAQATATFFVVLVNFGFNITATQEISQYRNNKNKISEIVSSVLILKCLLIIFSIILLTAIIPFIPEAKNNYLLFYVSLYLCLNDLVLPIWYFQGIEEMKYITYLNSFSKILTLILILVLIKTPEDYIKVPIIYLVSGIIIGFIAMRIIFVNHKIKFVYLGIRKTLSYARSSFYIFLSRASFVLMESSSKIIINSFFGLSELAVYDFLLKITEALRKPFSLLSQAFFPYLSKTKNMKMSKRILMYSTLVSFFVYIALVLASDRITLFFLDLSEIDNVFYGFLILGFSIPLSCLTWGLGENVLVVKGHLKEYNFSTILQIGIYFLFAGVLYLMFGTLTFKMILLLYVIPIFFEVLLRLYFVKKFKIFGNT